MTIGIDIDQVLADTLETYLKFHNQKHNSNFKIEDCYSLNWWDVFGISEEQFVKDYDEFCETGVAQNIKPVKGSQEAIKMLRSKHDLIAITARPKSIAKNTKEWINKHYPEIFSEIYFTRDKTLGDESMPKYQVCHNIGANILVDDSLEYAEDCALNNIKVYLFDWPWNQKEILPESIVRVRHWNELIKHLL